MKKDPSITGRGLFNSEDTRTIEGLSPALYVSDPPNDIPQHEATVLQLRPRRSPSPAPSQSERWRRTLKDLRSTTISFVRSLSPTVLRADWERYLQKRTLRTQIQRALEHKRIDPAHTDALLGHLKQGDLATVRTFLKEALGEKRHKRKK